MNIIIGGIGSGKTRKLVEISHKTKIPILCAYRHRVLDVLGSARNMNLEIPRPILVGDLKDGHRYKEVLVDNAELVLADMLKNTKLRAISLNVETKDLEVIKHPNENLLYNGFNKIEEITATINGVEVKREKLILPSAVGGIVTNQNGELMLVKQYRPTIEQYTWEIPAGVLDKPSLTPYEVLVEELREECGIKNEFIDTREQYEPPTPLFDYYMVTGSSEATMEIYEVSVFETRTEIVVNDKDVEQAKWFTKKEIRAMMETGNFVDSKTLLAVMHYMK